jgi:hypothetical protein
MNSKTYDISKIANPKLKRVVKDRLFCDDQFLFSYKEEFHSDGKTKHTDTHRDNGHQDNYSDHHKEHSEYKETYKDYLDKHVCHSENS